MQKKKIATQSAERPTPATVYNKREERCPTMVVSAADFDTLVVAKADLERQLAEARKQRDRLAEALKKVRERVKYQDPKILAMEEIDQALAAVKETK